MEWILSKALFVIFCANYGAARGNQTRDLRFTKASFDRLGRRAELVKIYLAFEVVFNTKLILA
jgi:hypothetical protein